MKDDASQPVTTAEPSATAPAPVEQMARIVDFQPGIRINYQRMQVEIDSKVILRKAPLELFAYAKAPTPKQHETILTTDARPLHIYQALGLIGLTPGHPLSYDSETGKTTPPSGDPVDVLVRYEIDGKTNEHSACDWMLDLDKNKPMERQHWLFTGSRQLENGKFGADFNGTLVTVVNFDTSLVGLPELHSDSDAELWLTTNTEAIPPVGTPVTLILRLVKPVSPEQKVRVTPQA